MNSSCSCVLSIVCNGARFIHEIEMYVCTLEVPVTISLKRAA